MRSIDFFRITIGKDYATLRTADGVEKVPVNVHIEVAVNGEVFSETQRFMPDAFESEFEFYIRCANERLKAEIKKVRA